MSDHRPDQPATAWRQLTCARCGVEFGCNPGGPCWCSEEPVRLPLPVAGKSGTGFNDCLCRDCLHAIGTASGPAA